MEEREHLLHLPPLCCSPNVWICSSLQLDTLWQMDNISNKPPPASPLGSGTAPLLSMFWNNTNGHAYTPYNSFKQSVQSKSTLVYRTEFHNLIFSLIFWWTSRKFSSKWLLTFVLHVRWVAVIRVIRPGSGWPDRQGASSTCLGTSSPAGFSLPWQP